MSSRKRRDAQSVELRAAGMTLAQISRTTGQHPKSRTALVSVSLALFGLAAAAASYVALGPTSTAPRPIAALDPVVAQDPSPSVTPADVAAVIARIPSRLRRCSPFLPLQTYPWRSA
ncbi:hypothetical protein KUL25_17330 [Rhodobacteraceae bacterium N5(2021)]|uniref:Uncharacterized protein n=1 Tax=Gymnodinialimonas phycosphaerae TaxID=2841589 RepID=A0A975YFA5_9RHOB|nr:hypothetical protein [Gymnodinialimonas phycosphaerae]MBY4894523.1 hypothetical protein [Gymnodinialimonas phycosphaerae]